MDDTDGLSEQRIIENYLQQYRLEDCLDEIINQVVMSRPANPYMAIASAFESRTLPEIMDVILSHHFSSASYSVKASIITNVGSFTAIVPYGIDLSTGNVEPKDYTVLNGKLKELLIPIAPTNLKQIDEAVATLPDIQPSEALALSVAAARGAAKFKGVKLYEYFSELVGLKEEEVCIPAPVPALAAVNIPSLNTYRTIQLFPVRASNYELAVAKLHGFFHKLSHMNDKFLKPIRYSPLGTPSTDLLTIEEVVKAISQSIIEMDELANLKLGLGYQSEQSIRPSDPSAASQAYLYTAGVNKTGQELVEQLIMSWGDLDFVSVEGIVAAIDIASLRYFKKRIQEIVFEARSSGGDKLKYCAKGIGNDASCNLQVPIESTTFAMVNLADMEKQLLEVPYNAVKLHLFNVTNLTKALEIVEKAKKLNLPLILDTSSLLHKSQPATIDDFEADFAVGVGAYQFYGNGLNDTAYNNKLNRLLEINRENDSLPYAGAKFRSGPQT